MTSYQKRVRELDYYAQRTGELELIIVEMYKYMKQKGIKPIIPLPGVAVTGDMFINDVNMGQLQKQLIAKAEV